MKKVLSIILIMFCLIIISSNVFAAGNGFVESFKGATGSDLQGGDTVKKLISDVLFIVRTIGAGVAIVILLVIGTKYMLSSAGERAEIKKYAIHYIIGAVVLFASSGIISIIKNFVDASLE